MGREGRTDAPPTFARGQPAHALRPGHLGAAGAGLPHSVDTIGLVGDPRPTKLTSRFSSSSSRSHSAPESPSVG